MGAATQGREAPSQPSPRGRSQSRPHNKQQEWTPAPWGGLGRGFSQSAVFLPAPAGLFLPPTAAFFTVVSAGVMHCMTVVMAVTTRRKTCFPTVGTTGTTKAKPPAVPTAFCVYFIPMWVEQIKANSGMPTSSGRGAPSQPSPRGRSQSQTAQNTARMSSRPLGRVGEGLLSTTPTTNTNISRIFSSSTKITTIFTT